MHTVALLRAVNLAGKRMVAMADLRAMLETMGFTGVRSLLQSGNLVFEAGRRAPAALEAALAAASKKTFAVEMEWFVRTRDEWTDLVAHNPFPDEASRDPGHLVAICLSSAPTKQQVTSLQTSIAGRERVLAHGRTAYIVYPDGIGNSKLTAAKIERALGARGTGRNWNTVLKIAAALEN
jgi:uncharacterized protein (DUF1697 family)